MTKNVAEAEAETRRARIAALQKEIASEGRALSELEDRLYPVRLIPPGRPLAPSEAEVNAYFDGLRDVFGDDKNLFEAMIHRFADHLVRHRNRDLELTPGYGAAQIILRFAARRLCDDERLESLMVRMSQAYMQRSKAHVANRDSIRRAVERATKILDGGEARAAAAAEARGEVFEHFSKDERREWMASQLSQALGAIDTRLNLSLSDAIAVLAHCERANASPATIAANWAWRAGLESKKAGEERKPFATKRAVDLFKPSATKRKKTAKRRARIRSSKTG